MLRTHTATLRTTLAAVGAQARKAILITLGFALISLGAYTWDHAAGLVVAGVSLVVLQWLSEDPPPTAPAEEPTP